MFCFAVFFFRNLLFPNDRHKQSGSRGEKRWGGTRRREGGDNQDVLYKKGICSQLKKKRGRSMEGEKTGKLGEQFGDLLDQ